MSGWRGSWKERGMDEERVMRYLLLHLWNDINMWRTLAIGLFFIVVLAIVLL